MKSKVKTFRMSAVSDWRVKEDLTAVILRGLLGLMR